MALVGVALNCVAVFDGINNLETFIVETVNPSHAHALYSKIIQICLLLMVFIRHSVLGTRSFCFSLIIFFK